MSRLQIRSTASLGMGSCCWTKGTCGSWLIAWMLLGFFRPALLTAEEAKPQVVTPVQLENRPYECTGLPCPPAPPGISDPPDGCLFSEELSILDISAPPGPDALDGRRGAALIRVDCISDGNLNPLQDGFRDAGLRFPDIPLPSGINGCQGLESCYDNFSGGAGGIPSVRSPFNTGKVPYVYFADSDGLVQYWIVEPYNGTGNGVANTVAAGDDIQVVPFGMPVGPGTKIITAGPNKVLETVPGGDDVVTVDPATDDSQLYVGLDIANGDPQRVPPAGSPFAWIDVEDLNPGLGLCDDGVRTSYNTFTPPFPGPVFGMPFDVDGDGNPQFINRFKGLMGTCAIGGSLRETRAKRYAVALYDCLPNVNPCENYSIFNKDTEFFQVELRIDATSTLIQLSANKSTDPAEFSKRFPVVDLMVNGMPVSGWIQTFPTAGTDVAIAANRDALCGKDVEFLIKHVDSIADLTRSARLGEQPNFAKNRFRFAQGGLQTFSDTDGDSAAEDHVVSSWQVPLPQIEIKKQLRCLGEPDTAWRDMNSVIPGATVEYRILVSNTGNILLNVFLTDAIMQTDALDCIEVQSFLQATYYPAAGDSVIVNPAAPPANLNGLFFEPNPAAPGSFLMGVQMGQPRWLGLLSGLDVCNGVNRGDSIEIIFRVKIKETCDTCNFPGQINDILNKVLALGDPDPPQNAPPLFPPQAPDGDETYDRPGDSVKDATPPAGMPGSPVDTPREITQGFDDNVVSTNVLCRDFCFDKKARTCTTQPASNDPPTCLTAPWNPICTAEIDPPVNIPTPATPSSPIYVEYLFKVENQGEVFESYLISDAQFCSDVSSAPGVDFANTMGGIDNSACELCPTGSVVKMVAPGDSARVRCLVRFANEQALKDFLKLDDNRPACRALIPGTQTPDMECYKNCASVKATALPGIYEPKNGNQTANSVRNPMSDDVQAIAVGQPAAAGAVIVGAGANNLLNSPASPDDVAMDYCPSNVMLSSRDDATICYKPCVLEVTKRVRCLPNCQTPTEDMCATMIMGTFQRVTGGSCVEFEIKVKNTALPGDPRPICRLRVTDTLSGTPGQITPPAFADVKFLLCLSNGTSFMCQTPAGFNVDGIPFEFDVNTCGAPYIGPMDILKIRFKTAIPTTAVPTTVISEPRTGGNGRANSTKGAGTDDIQLIATNAPVMPGAAIILPGLNGVINSTATPDDVLVNDILNQVKVEGLLYDSVNLFCPPTAVSGYSCMGTSETRLRVEDCKYTLSKEVKCSGDATYALVNIIEPISGGNGIANTTALIDDVQVIPVGQPAAPGAIIVSPGANGVIDSMPGGDDMLNSHRDVLRGQTLNYRIRLCNKGTVAISQVTLKDTLTCLIGDQGCSGGPNCPDCCDLSRVANVAVQKVTDCTATSGSACVLAPAFVPDGVQRVHSLCSPLQPGESLLITFDVTTNPDFNIKNTPYDCQNTIEASVPQAGLPPDVCGNDCPTLKATATANLLIPGLFIDKDAKATCANGAMFTTIPAGPNMKQLGLCDDCFPVMLEYTFKVTNTCDAPLCNVMVCDDQLLKDICKANSMITNPADRIVVDLGNCDLCAGTCGTVNNPGPNMAVCDNVAMCTNIGDLAPGQMKQVKCKITIPARPAGMAPWVFDVWASLDNPPEDPANPKCYVNAGYAKGRVCPTICYVSTKPAANVRADSNQVKVCRQGCMLDVAKYVRCVNCTDSGSPPPPPCQDFRKATKALPNAEVEYCVVVSNTGMPGENICKLQFCDYISLGTSCIEEIPGSASITVFPTAQANPCTAVGGIPCNPPEFANVNFRVLGTCFTWTPATSSCGRPYFAPGEMVVLKFRAKIKDCGQASMCGQTANQPCVKNDVIVRGLPCCAVCDETAGGLPDCNEANYICVDSDFAKVFLQKCALVVTKNVKCVPTCEDAGSTTIGTYNTNICILPGQKVAFRIQIMNAGSILMTKLQIMDTLFSGPCGPLGVKYTGNGSTNCGFVVSNVKATIGAQDITGVMFGGSNPLFIPDGGSRTYDLSARPGGTGGLDCNETLTITFCVETTSMYTETCKAIDFCNEVKVAVPDDGLPDLCLPPAFVGGVYTPRPDKLCPRRVEDINCDDTSVPLPPCARSWVDIKVPKLCCERKIIARKCPTTCPPPCSGDPNEGDMIAMSSPGSNTMFSIESIPDSAFPIKLVYEFTAINSGETDFKCVQICDGELISDLTACMDAVGDPDCRNLKFLRNDFTSNMVMYTFSPNPCTTAGCNPGAGTTCTAPFDIAKPVDPCADPNNQACGNPANSNSVKRYVVFYVTLAGRQQLTECLPDRDGYTGDTCYEDEAQFKGYASLPIDCQHVGCDDCRFYSSTCRAQLCVCPDCPDCFYCWEPTGLTLDVKGCQEALICYQPVGGSGTIIGPPAPPTRDPLTDAVIDLQNAAESTQLTVDEEQCDNTGLGSRPAMPSFKGSLLIYAAIEVKWDCNGRLLQNSIISITNDAPYTVKTQWYFINGDPAIPAVFNDPDGPSGPLPPKMCDRAHPGWNKFNTTVTLTGNESTYWCASNGQPRNRVPFVGLDPGMAALDADGNVAYIGPNCTLPPRYTWPGRADNDPLNPNGRVLRGYAIAWAINNNSCQINWNHLVGSVTNIWNRQPPPCDTPPYAVCQTPLVNSCFRAWEYKSWAFRVVDPSMALGAPVGTCGNIKLDGIEYQFAPGKLLFDFYRTGSKPFGTAPYDWFIDTDLTLVPVSIDLKPSATGPPCTVADMLIWDETEQQCSGLRRCVCCWDQEMLCVIDSCFTSIPTIKGKACIDGKQITNCQFGANSYPTQNLPLVGVASKCLLKVPPCPTTTACPCPP